MAGSDPLIGRVIDGRYAVEEVLGEGGMGLVYRARHVKLDKPLALKVLRAEVSMNTDVIDRFQQEAKAATAIGNEHIIDVSDFGTLEDGSTYFVMEMLQGTDLTGAIETAVRMPAERVVHIGKQLCRALGAAHGVGIVHRDLKPDNIFLIERSGSSDFVKVLDFGIAKVGSRTSKLTRTGQIFGTPHYMSPEQCSGAPVDHRTDIYALGVILYEMCTGSVPFDAEHIMAVLTKHMHDTVEPPKSRHPLVPDGLEAIILRSLEKKPEARYADTDEMLADLERLEAGSPVVRPSFATGTGAAIVERSSARRWVAIAAGCALVLSAIGLGWAMSKQPESPPVAASQLPQPEPEPDPEPEPEPDPDPEPEPEREPEPEPEIARAPSRVEVETLRLTSTPSGARVTRRGIQLGRTPLELPRPTGTDQLALELTLDGYHPARVAVWASSPDVVDATLHRRRVRIQAEPSDMTMMDVGVEPPAMMWRSVVENPYAR